jgi:endonuclease YncB( thermonuclease family)
MKRLLSLLVLLFVPASSASAQLVTRVVDGDTIVVADVGTVRLIGVDTPETVDPRKPVQFFGKEASEFTRRLAQGKVARLEFDYQRTDKYQRTLAYVYLPDGTFLNAEIVKQGYGTRTCSIRSSISTSSAATNARRERPGADYGAERRTQLWAPVASPAEDSADPEQLVYVTRTGTKYHREGCRLRARSQIPIALKNVGRHTPCSVCNPPTLRGAASTTSPGSAITPAVSHKTAQTVPAPPEGPWSVPSSHEEGDAVQPTSAGGQQLLSATPALADR